MGLSGWIKGLLDRHHQLSNWIGKERPPSFWLTGFFNPQGFLTSMKQEVTRQRKAQNWSLDEVEFTSDVLKEVIQGDDGKIEGKQLNSPAEGVYIHGLYLEGAGWNKAKAELANLEKIAYSCPVYKYPLRNDRYLIFRCYLKAEAAGAPQHPNKGLTAPMKWKLAGVALLCTKD